MDPIQARTPDGAPAAPAPSAFENFGRRTVETFASLAVISVVGGLYVVALARWIGPHGVGVVSVLSMLSATGALLVADPLALANVYFGAMRPADRPTLLTNSLLIAILGGVFVGATGFAILQAVGVDFGATSSELALIAASIPATAGGKLVALLILSEGRSRAYNVLTAAGQMLLVVLTITLFILWDASVGVAVYAYLASVYAHFLVAAVWCGTRPGAVSRRLLGEAYRYGLRGSVGNAFQFLNYRLDFFLVSGLRGSAEVGVYSVAVSLAELLWKIPTAAATILFPRVAAGGHGGVAFTSRISRISLLITTASAGILAAIGYPLIHILFGSEFSRAYVPLLLLMPGVVALSIANILTSDLAGRGKPEYASFAAGITLALTIGLDLTLIPQWGASGAAVASTVAYTGAGLFLLVIFSRLLGVSVADLIVPRRSDLDALPRRRTRPAAE
jgi:O-antigen/teichoic acid export membrane protein